MFPLGVMKLSEQTASPLEAGSALRFPSVKGCFFLVTSPRVITGECCVCKFIKINVEPLMLMLGHNLQIYTKNVTDL